MRNKGDWALQVVTWLAALLLSVGCGAMSAALAEDVPLDLTTAEAADAAQLSQLIAQAGAPSEVTLGERALTLVERRQLMAEFPETFFSWTFDLYGVTVSSEDTAIDFRNKRPKNLEQLMDYLDCLPRLEKLDMYRTYVSWDMMDTMSQRFPRITFGWTIKLSGYSIRTDVTAFSTLKNGSPPYLKSSAFEVLKHCKQLVALDLGHNAIDDLSFLRNLPQLKVLILARNKITDISPLAELKDLEYLELFNNNITDISPLAGLTKLLDLNLCINRIQDISPLMGLTQLERLWLSMNRTPIPQEQTDALLAALPDTHVDLTVRNCTGGGWRKHPHYSVIRKMFYKREYIPWDGLNQK